MKRSFKHIRSHSVAGKRFQIVWRRPDVDSDGKCDHPSEKDKKIFIDPNLPEQDLLETVVHEITHAGCFSLDEDTVDQIALAASSLLWKMGFRLGEGE